MANPATLTLHASGAESGAGLGAAVDLGTDRTAALLTLRGTVIGAELNVTLQTSPDGSTGWRTIATLSPMAAVGAVKRAIDQLERYVRCTWPAPTNATFELVAEAHQLYATNDDLLDSLGQELIDRAETKRKGARARALIKGTAAVASALTPIYPMPLTTIPADVADAAGSLAALILLTQNGLAGGGIDALVSQRAEAARLWLKEVAARKRTIEGIAPAPEDAVKGSSGNPATPDTYPDRFSNNWGDFG